MLAAVAAACRAPAYTINFGSLLGEENAFSVNTPDGNNVTLNSPSGADTLDVASVTDCSSTSPWGWAITPRFRAIP